MVWFFSFGCGQMERIQGQDDTGWRYADSLHRVVFTVDSHTDTPLNFVDEGFDFGEFHSDKDICYDLPKMNAGDIDAVYFGVFVVQKPLTPENMIKARDRAIRLYDSIDKVVERYRDKLVYVTTPGAAYKAEAFGKKAIFSGVENGFVIMDQLELIKYFQQRGATYITLCHSLNNQICDSANDTLVYGGLSPFGEKVVKEMNRLGVMIDVSHVSDSSFFDIVKLSKSPVIASHSCSRAICDNPRNLSDEMLLQLKQNGGVVQLCILSDYVKKMPANPERDKAFGDLWNRFNGYKNLPDSMFKVARAEWNRVDKAYPRQLATVKDAVDHIDHMVSVMGIDHVGIGTDFDGGGGLDDCRDATELRLITRELVRRGYSAEDIRKIWGGNLMRVFQANLDRAERQ
jgi:membrane dipeptidase